MFEKENAKPNTKKMTREVNWKDLPSDILSIIAEKNINAVDYIRLAAVCVSWQSVCVENQNNIPWQTPALLLLPKKDHCSVYNLCEKRLYKTLKFSLSRNNVCRGSNHGWLVIVSANRDIRLMNPFSPVNNTDIIKIPALPCRNEKTSGFSTCYLRKAVLSANPSETRNFVVMAIQQEDEKDGTLSLWRNGDKTWTPIENYTIYCTDDVICYKYKFYAHRHGQGVFVFDVNRVSVRASLINTSHSCGSRRGKKYLVESCGELLLIVRQSSKELVHNPIHQETTDYFLVYKLDETEKKWIHIRNLGDRVLYIGDHYSSLSLSTSNMPECKCNNIHYIFEDWGWRGDWSRGFTKTNICYHDFGVYNLEDCANRPLYPIDSKKTAEKTHDSKKTTITLAPIFIQPTLRIKSSVER